MECKIEEEMSGNVQKIFLLLLFSIQNTRKKWQIFLHFKSNLKYLKLYTVCHSLFYAYKASWNQYLIDSLICLSKAFARFQYEIKIKLVCLHEILLLYLQNYLNCSNCILGIHIVDNIIAVNNSHKKVYPAFPKCILILMNVKTYYYYLVTFIISILMYVYLWE